MTPLDILADRAGIESEFRDAGGQIRQTTRETKSALLAAMGMRADGDAQAAAELDNLERVTWSRKLPPACVVCAEPGPIAVDITMPAGTGEIGWRIALEAGGERTGSAGFETLALAERRNIAGQMRERRRLILEQDIPWGYHRLTLRPGDAETMLIVTPGRCWLPASVREGRRLWGVAAQLYLLRSRTNWGIGDFTDLKNLVEMLSHRGADVVGLNPLHAMFLDDPEHASPYSPASRLLLNVLNIDVAALPELDACPQVREMIASRDFQDRLHACRATTLVDYSGVAELKLKALRAVFHVCRSAPGSDRWQAFEAFRRERGDVLARGCVFQALREQFAASGADADWHAWPEEYRDPDSPSVARFAAAHSDGITFRIWLQWLADQQLAAAAAAAAAQGMAVGLYRDLAVGADKSGSETWADQAAVVSGAQVGAPPDIHNPAGQDWGLPPFHPRALRQEAYRSFVDLVRANMRHAGGLRIDHVMALQHLYWIPQGRPPSEGAYVRYPLEDLVGILALESHRNECLVVGEDLGTVPDGFRERMAQANILSYRVLFFETDEHGYLPPAAYPPLALAVAGSHDLPTLRGWWEAADIEVKARLGLFPDTAGPDLARQARAHDRARLVEALRREDLMPDGAVMDVARLIRTAHAYLARSRSALAIVQLDDITDEADQVNVPATSDEHPNWRRRLSLTLEEMSVHPRLHAVARIFASERGEKIPCATSASPVHRVPSPHLT